MKNIPKKIYLHIEDEWEVEDFEDAEVTWSDERISDEDIEYVVQEVEDAFYKKCGYESYKYKF